MTVKHAFAEGNYCLFNIALFFFCLFLWEESILLGTEIAWQRTEFDIFLPINILFRILVIDPDGGSAPADASRGAEIPVEGVALMFWLGISEVNSGFEIVGLITFVCEVPPVCEILSGLEVDQIFIFDLTWQLALVRLLFGVSRFVSLPFYRNCCIVTRHADSLFFDWLAERRQSLHNNRLILPPFRIPIDWLMHYWISTARFVALDALLLYVFIAFIGLALFRFQLHDFFSNSEGPFGECVGIRPAASLKSGEDKEAIYWYFKRVSPREIHKFVVFEVMVKIVSLFWEEMIKVTRRLFGHDVHRYKLLQIVDQFLS